jgi:hypothetical protein
MAFQMTVVDAFASRADQQPVKKDERSEVARRERPPDQAGARRQPRRSRQGPRSQSCARDVARQRSSSLIAVVSRGSRSSPLALSR